MSDLKFSCPHCSQHISCGVEWSGLQIKCPGCQNDIAIPRVASPATPPLAVPAPGPLRVNVPAQHAAPPPAASAPPLPRSSLSVARHAPPPQQEEPAGGPAPPSIARENWGLQWAGLVGAFLVTSIIIAMAVTWKPPADSPWVRLALARAAEGAAEDAMADEDEEENSLGSTIATSPATTAAAASATPQWTLDLQAVQIPEAKANGQISGGPFTADRAYLQRTPSGYLFTVRQGTGFQSDREIQVVLALKPGDKLEGNSWNITTDTPTGAPRVIKRWMQNARQQTRVFTNGYAMKLEFGQPANNEVPTRMFVALPDEEKTFVAGTINAAFLVTAAAGQQPRRQ